MTLAVLQHSSYTYNNYFMPNYRPIVHKAFRSLALRGKHKSQHTPYKRDRNVFGGIIRAKTSQQEYKYALVQGRYTGKWSFPKGHANVGEEPIKCSLREIYEETGINTLPTPSDFCKTMYGHYFTFDLSSEVPLNPIDTHEIMQTKWVTLDEMAGMSLNADAYYYFKKCRSSKPYNSCVAF
jgi:8-oxo-dGTP pyrophosphatase MutT (NUDIX family)